MRMKRLLGTATAAAVLLAGPLSMAAASAQEADAGAGAASGVGTGSVRSTVLGVDVGSLLNLSVLDEPVRNIGTGSGASDGRLLPRAQEWRPPYGERRCRLTS